MSFAQLPVGDYIVSDRMCVERKTVSDFESSVMNSRLFEQIDRLSAGFAKPVLLIEGDDCEFLMHPNVVLGTIISLYTDHNIQVIRSKETSETALMLAKLAEREQSSKEHMPKIAGSKRAFTNSQWQMLILSAIPGVGPKLSRSLIRHFKSIKNVVSASTDELMDVEKVGKKKAAKIYELLNEEFNEV